MIKRFAVRFITRSMLWRRILSRVEGATIKFQLGLIVSAIIDTVIFGLHPVLAASPKSYFSGVARSKKFHYSWQVRKGTDDIYNVMPGREGDVHDLILSTLKPGDVFIDVGANIGYYTVLASGLVGAEGTVVAFEPVLETVEMLKINCNLNHSANVEIIPCAAWSDECILPIYFSKGHYGMASMRKSEGSFISTKAMPLDSICGSYSTIKMLKIDVEGAEYQVLCGASETLKKTKYVILEWSENYDKIVRLLRGEGFSIHNLSFTTHICAQK